MSEHAVDDADIKELLNVPDADIVFVLGRKYLPKEGTSTVNIQKTVFVLTQTTLYQIGAHYTRDAKGKYKKARGSNDLPRAALRGVSVTEKDVSPNIGRIGVALLVVGAIILLGGLIEGSAMGVVGGLFIGAAWLMVPGVLMLLHARTGAETYLDIIHENGVIAALKEWYSEEDIAALRAEIEPR